MTADTDLIKLYSARILALAADMPLTDRLETPDATAKKRAPLCGSTVTVDLTLGNGQITGYGQDVKACALGQAAAAVVGGSGGTTRGGGAVGGGEACGGSDGGCGAGSDGGGSSVSAASVAATWAASPPSSPPPVSPTPGAATSGLCLASPSAW